jgi:NADH dehydrogenase (ubiquinone) 1 beta subcomplex subunit 10
MVDNEIVNILRQRFEDCVHYEQPDHAVKCKDILEQYNKAAENWFIKCKLTAFGLFLLYNSAPLSPDGDLGAYGDAKAAYFKQKHRMLWERRHGEVGTGMKAEGDN